MSNMIFLQVEVSVARSVFGPWLAKARRKTSPSAYLAASLKEKRVGERLPGECAPVYAWRLTGNTFEALDSEYRVLWRKPAEHMALAALSKDFQLALL